MFKQFKKRGAISLAMIAALASGLLCNSIVSVGAATDTISSSGGSGQSDVVATITPSKFSATVPYLLPISVDADQNVYVADNAEIINNSNGPIKVSSAVLTTNNGWSLVEDGTDFSSVPVNSKQFTMEMQGSPVETTGIIDKTVFSSINGNDSLPVTYNADVAVQGDSLSGVNIANVVFTLEWDSLDETQDHPIVVDTVQEGGLYTIKTTGLTLSAGEELPNEPATGDTYEYGDYEYIYNSYWEHRGYAYGWYENELQNGWGVRVKDTGKSTYGEIISEIAGEPVNTLQFTFYGCTSFTTAPTIPNSITDMSATFNGCHSLTTAPSIPSNVTDMTNTFSRCNSLKTYVGSTDIDGNFSNYKIPNSVTDMNGTFQSCGHLTTAPAIPNSVTDMSRTFNGCDSLTTAPIIPNSVTNMAWTFDGCNSLKTYVGSTDTDGDFSNYKIPNSVTDMSNTFANCTSLTTAPTIPNSVTNMLSTFWQCTSLTTAPTIPSSVTNMYYTFQNCTNLTGIIEINANPASCNDCFCLSSAGRDITLTGTASSATLQRLANTSTSGYRKVYDVNGNILKQ